jgi:hypothetical protein
MRRLIFAAAVGTFVLAGCSDQTRESPTEPSVPPPEEHLGTSCEVVRFPLLKVSGLIIKVFPYGRLRLEALARAAAIKLLWDTCHPALAQKGVVAFVNWMNLNFQAGNLIGTDAQRSELITTLFTGVGLSSPPSTALGPDYGIGFFDPNSTTPTVVKTTSGVALTELQPGSFDEPTTIVVSRRPDDSDPLNFPEENQFPPFFDYDAINASGNHTIQNDEGAIVAFCLLDSDFVTYPANRRIGHNPVLGAPNFPFEILEPVDPIPQRLLDVLDCENLAPNTESEPIPTFGFGGGLPGVADAAWRTAGHYLGPIARAVFLPQPLAAATLGTLPPPIGGRAPSLSPFGVVEPIVTSTTLTSGTPLAIVGTPLALTATVNPAPPTSQEPVVEFFDGSTSLGSASLNADGVATFTTSTLSLVQHSLTAHFPGTATNAASTSSAVVQNMIQRFNDGTSFSNALGEAATLTEDFNSFEVGTSISSIFEGVLNVTSTFANLEVFGTGNSIFGFDETTRAAGNGRYDLTFVTPLTKNALAFDVVAKDPATDPAHAVVTAGTGSATFSVQNESSSESTPVFVGFIATVPLASVGVIEGPEIGGTGNEEIALDNFVVAVVSLPLPSF